MEPILRDILNTLSICLTDVRHNPERLDGVINSLESIITTISLVFQDETRAGWTTNLSELLIQTTGILTEHLDNRESHEFVSRFTISRATLETLISLNFSVPKMSRLLGCCTRTIERRMNDLGLLISDTYTPITDTDLEALVISILMEQPNTGYKRMKGHLHCRGVKVTERRLRCVMRTSDPMGVYQRTVRRNRTIRRRQYYVKYSNEIWHIDANLKLARWGFVIRAGVDGKSRAATYIAVSSDNKSETHLESFLEGVTKWGLPLRTRTDKGKENIGIARCMIENRGTGRSSHICGRSVHNQRVERFWRDLSEGCITPYYNLFHTLEEDGYLEIDNLKHLYILHYLFIPRLNLSVQEFAQGWNSHPLSTEQNMTPLQIMAINLFPAAYDSSITDLVDNVSGELMISNIEDLIQLNRDTITNPLNILNTLSEEENEKLVSFTASDTEKDIIFGYEKFCRALEHILN